MGAAMYVKRVISPVSLRMMIQTARFAEMTRAFSRDELAEFLGLSAELTGKIAGESVRTGLVECEGSRFFTTPFCSRVLKLHHASDRAGLHDMLMRHPGYAFFTTLLKSASPISLNECMDLQQSGPAPFNRAELDMVCSWAEEIRSVQQNFFTGQYYAVGELHAKFITTFMKVYYLLETPIRPSYQKKPVRIHILREFVCQRLGISRADFNNRFIALCAENPEHFYLVCRIVPRPHKPKKRKCRGRRFPDTWLKNRSGDYMSNGIVIRGRAYRSVISH